MKLVVMYIFTLTESQGLTEFRHPELGCFTRRRMGLKYLTVTQLTDNTGFYACVKAISIEVSKFDAK